jgi:hypothetical protein
LKHIIFRWLVGLIAVFTVHSAGAQVNSATVTLQILDSKKTVEVRAEGVNCSGNDWSFLRDSASCYPIIFSVSNPLDREIRVNIVCSMEGTYSRRSDPKLITYESQITVSPRSTASRLRGLPLAMKPVFSGSTIHKGRVRGDTISFEATLDGIRTRRDYTGRLDLNCKNFWGGRSYDWAEANQESEGIRSLVICPISIANQSEIQSLKRIFNVQQNWSPEILPQSSRPLSALQRLILFGVNPEDLSKGQREALESAVFGGLDVYLIGAPDGSGLGWSSYLSNTDGTSQPRIGKSGSGRWIGYDSAEELDGVLPLKSSAASTASRRNLAALGVNFLDRELRPGDPSDLTLFLMAFYVLVLIPGIFFSLKKKKKSIALLWLIPGLFAGSVVVVTIVGVGQYGVLKKKGQVAGVIQAESDGETYAIQLIEGMFDPTGSEWERSLAANEELILDFRGVSNYREISLTENTDGTLLDVRRTYPRSMNYRIRSMLLDEPLKLGKAEFLWPRDVPRLPLIPHVHGSVERPKFAVNDKLGSIADVEVLDRFGIEAEVPFIGLGVNR